MPNKKKVISKIEKEIRLGEHWDEDCRMIDLPLLRDALILLKEQKAVVRCEDCKYWVGNGTDTGELPYWLPCKGVMRRPDYFCADGKRRNAK